VLIEIMKAWIGDRKDAPTFDAPGNIVFMAVDRATGNPTFEGTPGAITEAFIAGTQPGSMRE
jgi:membrane carboxypeptidase/penicillin-binding protein